MATVKLFLLTSGFVLLIHLAGVPVGADDEIPRGLLAEYTVPGRVSRTKVDTSLSFVWERDTPDQFLVSGPFSASWSGQVLIRAETTYTFHAFLQGEVTV